MVVLKKELFMKNQEFVEAASKLLYSFLEEGDKIPYSISEIYKVENGSSWSMTYESQPVLIALISRHERDLKNLPEFKECEELMRAEPCVSKHARPCQ